MPACTSLAQRLEQVEQRIELACRRNGRDRDTVRLMAVGKTRTARDLRDAHAAGVRCFGENYVDEALAKLDQLGDLDAEWHFIGPIQSNKTRALSARFDWVQTLDRAKIVRRLADQRPEDQRPLSVLIQVNIDREPQKAGCDPEEARKLADTIADRNTLELRGLHGYAVDGHVGRS
jgi:pyridoxal phosphate enzyme (YggS family)